VDDELRDGSGIRSYRDLFVWQRAIDLVVEVYELTRQFPADERFGLTSQMRRAAVSIPSNIAEGQARLTTQEFRRFLRNAQGSLAELDTQVTISRRLGFIGDAERLDGLRQEIGRMIHGLQEKLGSDPTRH
jgi:four helix bundle protein